MGFLDKGSLLKHRRLGYIVRINDIQNGNYVLGWRDRPEHRLTELLLRGPWSAADLVRAFSPQIQVSSKWDRLLDDSQILDEDPTSE